MAARNAFDGGPWPLMTAERVSLLGDFADALDDRRDLLIETVIAEAGIPRSQTEAAQVRLGLDAARQIPEISPSCRRGSTPTSPSSTTWRMTKSACRCGATSR